MTQDERYRIQLVITHCEMLLYNFEQSYSPQLVAVGLQSMIASFHEQFAFMHLVTSMFLVDKKKGPMGGACYQLLQPLGLAHLLDAIAAILNEPVGNTTFGDYVRISRNKLTVHGDLMFDSLPECVKQVTYDEDAIEQFEAAGERLQQAVQVLRNGLGEVLEADAEASQ